jgi:predicted nucleotidyltransferase
MLSNEQKNIIIDTLMPFNPTYIGLFGSYARNEESNDSDIDILYEFDGLKLSLFDLMDIEATLQNKLHKKVDLVSRKFLNKHIKSSVESDLQALYNVK